MTKQKKILLLAKAYENNGYSYEKAYKIAETKVNADINGIVSMQVASDNFDMLSSAY